MNAIKFIKDHGIKKAREVVNGAPDRATHLLNVEYVRVSDPRWMLDGYVSIADLKRLVESVGLVKSCGGIINAKHDVKYLDLDWDYDTPRVTRLKQAITDYESIENHVSPNCKVGVN